MAGGACRAAPPCSPAAPRRFPIEGNAGLAIRPRLRVSPSPMRLRGTALFIERVERGLAPAITPIVVPTNLSSGSPEDRELSLSASRHSWSSKRPARCGLSACPGTLPHLMDHIAMGVFDVFRSRTRRSSVNTKRRSPPLLRMAPASSFAVVPQRSTNRREAGWIAMGTLAPGGSR